MADPDLVGCSLGDLSATRPASPAPPVVPTPPAPADKASANNGDGQPKLAIISSGAVAGVHERETARAFLVAPTDVADHNTIRKTLLPVACWGTVDTRFAFDSSFIQPEMRADLTELRKTVEGNPGTLLSVFAHADPVGELGYNKLLSGRRARALFGLVTRDVAAWQALAATSMGRDKWEPTAFETMRVTLEAAGTRPPADRGALIAAYMNFLCTSDDGKTLQIARSQFLGKGKDANGKADMQGCGEFNPVRVLSDAEQKKFAPEGEHPERDARNAPNRRVLVFFFPGDTVVDPAKWPCPRVNEGIAGCQKRLWSDARQRVAAGNETREHPDERTFSCRFYDRIAGRSPCETVRESVVIRLYDQQGKQMPAAVYRLSLKGVILQDAVADAQGAFSVVVPGRAETAFIEWGPAPAKGTPRTFTFRDDLELGADPDDPDDAEALLINLGYSGGSPLAAKVTAFQTDYASAFDLQITGILDDRTRAALREVYTSDADNVRSVKSKSRG